MCLLHVSTEILPVSPCIHQTFYILNISSDVYFGANELILHMDNVNIDIMDETSSSKTESV